jgi:hypothetical protein
MEGKVKVVLNTKAVGSFLKGQEMSALLAGVTGRIQQTLGAEYETDVKQMGTRVISSVYTEDKKALKDNLENNTLLKAVQT